MTCDVATVAPTTPVRDIVDLLEAKRIKRVPVVHDGAVIGIISRANLLQALQVAAHTFMPTRTDDRAIRETLLAEPRRHKWADPLGLNVIVAADVVHLWGTVNSPEEHRAMRVAAENIPGVTSVEDHLALMPALPAL